MKKQKRNLFDELMQGLDDLADVRTNPRTLGNWEQGRAKPNAQAALLIRLVEKFPDTVERLAQI